MNNNRLFSRGVLSVIVMGCVLFLAIMACAGGTGSAPVPTGGGQEPVVALPTQQLALTKTPSVVETVPTVLPAIPERRRLTVEYPLKIRAGDSDVIILTLEVDDQGNITPTAQFEGNVVAGEVIEIPDLYESHNVIAEAKFDVAGLQISPPDLISQTLSRGQSLNFYWSVRPTDVGVYRGTIWFYLRFVDKVSGEESRRTVSAQIIEIEAVNFLGLSAKFVRTAGGVGSVIGAVVGFPFFEDIVKFLFRRKRRPKK